MERAATPRSVHTASHPAIAAFLPDPSVRTSTLTVTDKIYVKHHRRLTAQLESKFPKRAFSAATLDVLFSGDIDKLDDADRAKVLDFADAFLDCDCDANPYCGHPERKFIRYILNLRAAGLGPDAIVDTMTDDYMLYAYPGDILTFLDNAVRTLDAAEALAAVENASATESAVQAARESLL